MLEINTNNNLIIFVLIEMLDYQVTHNQQDYSKISNQSYVVCNFITVINTPTSYYTFITVFSPHGLKNEIYICIAHLLYCACFLSVLDRTRHITHTVFTWSNARAFIKFSAFPMQCLFKDGVYSRAAFFKIIFF